MKRTDRFTHALSLLLFLGLMAYLGAWAFGALESSLRTATVSCAGFSRSFEAEGIIIREEATLSLPEGAELAAQPGLRLGAGDVIAAAHEETLRAERSGLFARCDGYESLSPGLLDTLTADGLEKLLEAQPSHSEGYKLVSGTNWYFAAPVPEASAAKLSPGQTLELDLGFSVPASILRISEESGGQCAVIFRCSQALAESLSLRKVTATVTLERLEGLRVPVRALRQDAEGGYFVLVLTATLTEEKPVTVLHREEDWALLAIEDPPDALREGNTVILEGTL